MSSRPTLFLCWDHQSGSRFSDGSCPIRTEYSPQCCLIGRVCVFLEPLLFRRSRCVWGVTLVSHLLVTSLPLLNDVIWTTGSEDFRSPHFLLQPGQTCETSSQRCGVWQKKLVLSPSSCDPTKVQNSPVLTDPRKHFQMIM